jgi:hypothetical protein
LPDQHKFHRYRRTLYQTIGWNKVTRTNDEQIDANMWFFDAGNRLPSSQNKPLDGDPKLIEVAPTVEAKWFHRARSALNYGVPVKPKSIMTRFRWHGAPPDDVHRWGHYFLVSERFRTIVEQFEPGMHQFFPVTILGARQVVIMVMYVLVPNVALRCFSKLSYGYEPIGWEKHWGDHIWHIQGSCRDPRLIFEDAKVNGHHLWVAIDCWDRPIMVSNALRIGLLEANLTNMGFAPAESREQVRWALPEIVKSKFAVDPPWMAWLADE